jgi:hypothetical protein
LCVNKNAWTRINFFEKNKSKNKQGTLHHKSTTRLNQPAEDIGFATLYIGSILAAITQ